MIDPEKDVGETKAQEKEEGVSSPLSPHALNTPKTPLTPRTGNRQFLFVRPNAYRKAQKMVRDLQEENKKHLKDLLETVLLVKTEETVFLAKMETEYLRLFLEIFNKSILGALWGIKIIQLEKYVTLQDKQCVAEKSFIEDLTAYSNESDVQQRYHTGMRIFEKMVSECIVHVPNSISVTLKKNEGYEDLIENAQNIIQQIFESMNDPKLTDFCACFRTPLIIRMQEFADFLHRHPERWSTPDRELLDIQIVNLSRAANNIKEAISTLQSALHAAEHKRGILYYPTLMTPLVSKASETPEASPAVQNYLLRQIIGGEQQGNLLQNQLGQVIAVASQIQKTCHKRSSISEGMPSERLPRLTRILSSPENNGSALGPNSAPLQFNQAKDALHASMEEEKEEEVIEILDLTVPLIKTKKKHYCSRENPEKLAALWTRNPFIKAVNGALSFRYSLSQILKIYPDARKTAFPYLTLIDVTVGTIGGLVGCHTILNPKKPLTTVIRAWEAWVEGSIVFVFTMGSAINIYLALHPEENYISDVKFWTHIASIPISLQVLYQGWYSVSPSIKMRWFPEGSRKRYIATGLDALLKTFQYSRIFEMASLEFTKTSSQLAYHFIPAAPALLVVLGQHFTRYTERLTTLMTYLTSLILLVTLVEDLSSHQKQIHDDPITFYGRIAYWSALFIAANAVSIKQSVDFLAEYEGDPKIVIKKTTKKPDGNRIVLNPKQLQTLEKMDQTPITQADDIHKRRRSMISWMQDMTKTAQLHLLP